jgi:hypothetical protein
LNRARLALALGFAAAAGCASESIDPCAGRMGACVGVHVATEVQPIDQLRVTLERAQSMLTPTAPAGALDFPVRFAVMLPAGASGAHLDFDGLLAGAPRARASGDVVLGASGRATLDVTLTAPAPDGGADLAGVDFAGADFAGDDFAPSADLAGVDLAGARVTLTTSAVTLSGGAGTVTPLTVPVSTCGTNCSTYPAGTSVTVAATSLTTSVLLGWAGGVPSSCQGNSSCTFTLAADTGVVAVFSSAPMNRVFATSTTYTVAQLGASAVNADGLCQARAGAANLASPTSYRAFFSLAGVSAPQRLPPSRGWVRLDGLPFGDDMTSIVSGTTYYPIALDEFGNPSSNKVWTGTTSMGASGANCNDWATLNNTATAYYGYAAEGSYWWLALNTQGCDQSAALYCFQTLDSTTLTVDAPAGRRAFVTNSSWAPSVGPSAADALCASEGSTHGLGSSFMAYLNGSTANGLSRLNLTGGLWHRTDNVLLAPSTRTTAIESGDAQRLAPLITGPGGGRYGPGVSAWLGSASANCTDWTTSSSSVNGTVGSVTRAGAGVAPVNCGTAPMLLFCLEQ